MENDWLHRKGPTLAIYVMGGVPFLGAIVVALGALGANLRPGATLSMAVISVVAAGALVFLLARVRLAPILAAVAALLAWVAARLVADVAGARVVDDWAGIRPGTGFDLAAPTVVMLGAAALAIWRREAFDQPLHARALARNALEGGRALLRPSPGAQMRALSALGLLLVAFIVLGSMLPDAMDAEVSPWRGFAAGLGAGTGLVAGLGLLFSAFRLPDEEELASRVPAVVVVVERPDPARPGPAGSPTSASPPAPQGSAPPPSFLQGPAIGEAPPSLRERRRKR